MTFPIHTRWFQEWAPFIARIIFGGQFLLGASFKIPGSQGFGFETAMTAAAGIPYAGIFVTLAFVLEVVCGLALIVGWHTRLAAITLAVFTLALALIFYNNLSDLNTMGEFVSHLGFIAGLLYLSVYGAQHIAIKKDAPVM